MSAKRKHSELHQSNLLADFQQRLERLEEENAGLRRENARLTEENEQLRAALAGKAAAKASKPPKFTENYSLGDHERKRRKRRKRSKSTGCRPSAEKTALIDQTAKVYPEDVSPKKCQWQRRQCVWRIIDRKAVYVSYEIYAPAEAASPSPPGLRSSRSEFGIEIILILAFLHYWFGVSLDSSLEIMQFFTGLELSKGQADSLLSQLTEDWDIQYEAIAELIAHQMVVYVDETGWKVGSQGCYTWVFSAADYVLFRCGVSRGKAEAQAVLGSQFSGIGVSDNYRAYGDLFSIHQLCWAHLLRKAIKLALSHPTTEFYREFLDELYEIYTLARRYQADGRLSVGRAQKARELEEMILDLCHRAEAFSENQPEDQKERLPGLSDLLSSSG